MPTFMKAILAPQKNVLILMRLVTLKRWKIAVSERPACPPQVNTHRFSLGRVVPDSDVRVAQSLVHRDPLVGVNH